jgi:hypothetical protein
MYNNNGGNWDAASNYVGLQSPTININVDSWFGGGKSDKNGIKQEEPIVKPIAKDDVRNMSADANLGQKSDSQREQKIEELRSYYNSLPNQFSNEPQFYTTYDNRIEALASFFQIVGPEVPASIIKGFSNLFSLSKSAEIIQAEKSIILVTKEGVALPKGAKIPSEFVENPFRSSNYGIIQDGKFIEKLRIDPATPAGMKGPNYSHYHLNGSGNHLIGNWPWW